MSISGFPEWLPEVRLIEERIVATIREVYVSHGFTSIDHAAVEQLSALEANGIEGKEIFVLKRAQAHDDDEAKLALHFDLTVPFARYVAENLAQLSFPLKRFSLQKVWRGERPQRGRYREFYQFDIDIVARESLPLACDAEVVTVIEKAYRKLNLCQYEVRLNNRKVLLGFYAALGLEVDNAQKAVGIVDKIDKIGAAGVAKELTQELGLSDDKIGKILALSQLRGPGSELDQVVVAAECEDPRFLEGVAELREVLRLLAEETLAHVVIDFSLARGLGYYTGTILEVRLPEHPEFGSAGGGGRYDDLTSRFTTQSLPAVGASIGISRLIALIVEKKLIATKRRSTAEALVVVLSEESRPASNKIADALRDAQIPTEVFFKSPKLGKQIDYADQKGIRFVVFPNSDGGDVKVKDLEKEEQKEFGSIAAAIEWVRG